MPVPVRLMLCGLAASGLPLIAIDADLDHCCAGLEGYTDQGAQ